MSRPEPNSFFGPGSAVLSAVSAIPANDAPPKEPRQLSAAAQAIAEEHYQPAYSPIVLAGLVRAIEVALIVAVGFTV